MKTLSLRTENLFGAILMMAGCCIGAGMIGLPLLSMAAGLLPSSIAIVATYLFTTATGLVILEGVLWFEQRAGFFSIAESVLGKWGKRCMGFLFMALFYAIFVAYLDGGGQMFQKMFGFSRGIGITAYLACIALVLRMGIRGVDLINRFLLVGLVAAYCFIVGMGAMHIKADNLCHVDWNKTLGTLPILFISFGYQNLVPSLAHYLKRNVAATRFAIIVGNFIPMIMLLLWNGVILGLDPVNKSANGCLISKLLLQTAQNSSVIFLLDAFSFFALFTSFITVGISFVDFFRDGFIRPIHVGILEGLVLVPPFLVSLMIPGLFLQALSFAGGFIDVLLFGLMPIVILWIGRYKKGMKGPYQIAGGKMMLLGMGLLCLGLIVLNSGVLHV